MTTFAPRLPGIDRTWLEIASRFEDVRGQSRALVASDPDAAYGVRWFSLAGHTRVVAEARYAVGAPLDTIRALLHECGRELHEGLRRRGDTSDVPRNVVTSGHACCGLSALDMAMIAGDRALAASIAPLIWDPPGADYVGPRSVLCTDREQALAYATRELVRGDSAAAGRQLQRFAAFPEELVGRVKMTRGLVAGVAATFVDGLHAALAIHERRARRPHPGETDHVLFLAALGACSLALDRGLVARADLPAGNAYLPIDLIAAATPLD